MEYEGHCWHEVLNLRTAICMPSTAGFSEGKIMCVRFEDLIILFMKSVVFSSVMPCTRTSVNVHQYVKETFCVLLHNGNLRDVKEMKSTEGTRESLKGVRSSYLTFVRS